MVGHQSIPGVEEKIDHEDVDPEGKGVKTWMDQEENKHHCCKLISTACFLYDTVACVA